MRADIVIISDFYKNPDRIREYALAQQYFNPYGARKEAGAGEPATDWETTAFRKAPDCPFKSSKALVEKLEAAVGEKIDLDHWNRDFPVDAQQNLLPGFEKIERSCRWNCCFHVKYHKQDIGEGVHNHVVDIWNAVGETGWAGILYLNRNAPLESGLMTWRNKFGQPYEWMTGKERWELLDSYANVYNRLILCRGWMPHSGAAGFANRRETGRLYQTFFFKTLSPRTPAGLDESDFDLERFCPPEPAVIVI